MPDNYAVLAGKYQRALVSIRELEQANDRLSEENKKLEKDHEQIDKSTATLCETIMKKGDGNKDMKAWFQMSLKDKIESAQAGLEAHTLSTNALLNKMKDNLIKMQKRNSERTEKIAELSKQIDDAEQKYKRDMEELKDEKEKIINKLILKAQTGNVSDEELKKIVEAKPKPKREKVDIDEDTSTSFTVEEQDGIEEAVAMSIPAMERSGDLEIPAMKDPEVIPSQKTIETAEEKVRDIASRKGDEASKWAAKLTDAQKLIIRVIGEQGLSEMAQIISEAKRRFPQLPSESRLKSAMHGLLTGDDDEDAGVVYIESIKCPIPGSSNFCVYKLSDTGKDVFRYQYKKEPVKSEMETILSHHGSLAHGYGIQRTAKLLSEMECIQAQGAQVHYLTRADKYTVKLGGDRSYIPDIVITATGKDGKEKKQYIEYETVKCSKPDFFAKCAKIASFSQYINIIVPDNSAKEKVIERVSEWKQMVTEGKGTFPMKEGSVRVRISTFYELKDGDSSKKIPWLWEKSISSPKGKGAEK